MKHLASTKAIRAAVVAKLKPPPRLSLSEWADAHFVLSAESSAEPGRWHTFPYQKGIMDAITDPLVERVTVKKSARVGYTKMLGAAIGYYIDQDPSTIMVVQPTVDDAKGYSKEEIAPMLRDCPRLSKIVFEDAADVGPKDSGNTILHKKFPGGILDMVGANSGAGFRRKSRRVVMFDEVDGYPPSAGSDGDQIKLGIRRTEFYWNRKILAGSTPLVAGASRIDTMYMEGDQRRFYVPCTGCGHFDYLVFSEKPDGKGHHMMWPKDRPKEAHFVCSKNGCVIEHKDKREMVGRGEWRSAKPFAGHASFHIWAAYSFSPNASWGQLAEEFLESKDNPEKLRTFVNTILGETWQERGEAPEWERLYNRRELYQMGTVPEGVVYLTAGVDVQKDRWVYEVVGWGRGKESWSIEQGVIPGDTSNDADWVRLDELLARTFPRDGMQFPILMLGIDSGFNTQTVYNWARRHALSRVIALKGVSTARVLVGTPSPVDVKINGQRYARGYKVWPAGVSIAKSELYGWLKLPIPLDKGQPYPPGFCHFPEHGPDYFKQLTAEQLVPVVNRHGFTILEWQLIPGRENHVLDARVYARVAAAILGVDRLQVSAPTAPATVQPKAPAPSHVAVQSDSRLQRKSSLGLGRHGKGWFRR